ncbi:MAG: ABC transporter permease [Dethiobacter sp.]|nr:ABC transporter permease [Dethiobacter sp.]MCL5982368.1 ABC transporter permease [Bacillota bacterium]
MFRGKKKAPCSQSRALSAEHQNYLHRKKMYRFQVLSSQFLLLLFIVAAWEIAANLRLIDPFITSQPSRIVNTLVTLHHEGSLYRHTSLTVLETIIGFTLGTALGTLFAVILWWSKFLSDMLDPYLVVLNSLPKIALAPIIIVWFGHGMTAIIVIALLIAVIVTTLGVHVGFSQVDQEKVKLLRTFGASKWQLLGKVVLPASIPTMIAALKVNVGLSWVGVIVGEFLIAKAGLGFLIVYGGQVFQLDLVMTSVIILAVAAALMYQGVVLMERLLLKWH